MTHQTQDGFLLQESGSKLMTEAGPGFLLKEDAAALTHSPAGTIVIGTGTIGTRFLSNRYPAVEGLTAGTTKQTGKIDL